MVEERNYSEAELEAALRRAFIDNRAEFIKLDGSKMRSPFLRESLDFGIKKGWVCRDPDEDCESEQYTALAYKLTKKGRKYFGLVNRAVQAA